MPRRPGAKNGFIRCMVCGRSRPSSDYKKAADGKVHQTLCPDCPRPNHTNPKHNKTMRLKQYGLTPELFDEMVVLQHGRCAICGRQARLGVDHDHKTGVVRALLCTTCNVGLGMFKDNPVLIRLAAEYLEGDLDFLQR